MFLFAKFGFPRIAAIVRKSRPKLVALFLTALTATFAAVGANYLDETISWLKKTTLAGSLELKVTHTGVLERGQVVVCGNNNTREAVFLLSDKTKVDLAPGNYIVQVFYPNLQGEPELMMEKPIDIHRWETTKALVDYVPPNLITLTMNFPKKRYRRQEQLAFSIRSNTDGFLWIFSPEGDMPNLFFPNDSVLNNYINAGKMYNIPPLGAFTLRTRAIAGEDTIIGIVTETDNQGYAYECLKKVDPEVDVKVSLTQEEMWGYARAVLEVE
jgi:hypothetical protein